jgi:hypothetical protein
VASKLSKILFVDTNIWLDFYRSRNDAGMGLLRHLEQVSDRILVTYQLESEYKKNRQAAILEGMQDLKPPQQIPRPAMFSDAQATAVLNRNLREADKRVRALKAKLAKALANPAAHDPVYQACQRVFHQDSPLVLNRQDPVRHRIRRKAFRRYLHGCPPRKKSDTSIGDAFNWEWMVHCATERNAELVIVSRDSDYGATYENKSYINDHLRQEFSERVSKKRSLLLYSRLSEALKHFSVKVTPAEERAESEIVETSRPQRPVSQKIYTHGALQAILDEIFGSRAFDDLKIDTDANAVEADGAHENGDDPTSTR